MTTSIRIQVNPALFLRDPEETELGRRLVAQSVLLIEELGFERFTFKKLAAAIDSTEASMYRYFQSKHQLLSYLLAWYWSRLEYLIHSRTRNIESPIEQLQVALDVLTQPALGTRTRPLEDAAHSYINERVLHHIVTLESTKMYIPKGLQRMQREALMEDYERLCHRLQEILRAIRPKYRFPKTLVTTIIHSIQRASLYAELFPGLTDLRSGETTGDLRHFIEELALSALERA